MLLGTFKPSTQDAEAGQSLSSGQSDLQSKFQDGHSYPEEPCLWGKKAKEKLLLKIFKCVSNSVAQLLLLEVA